MKKRTIQREWSADFLKSMSLKTDPYAENIIAEVVANNSFNSLRDLFTSLNNDHQEITSSSLPRAVTDYFNAEMTLPVWADPKKIKLAQKVFSIYGPEVALILNFKALPLCYACKSGAKVLASTGRLTESGSDTTKLMRRLFETSQMVMNVMSPNGLSPAGRGIVTVKKVRLYHAAIRYFLTHPKCNPHGWDEDHYGHPINQEEMAGTLMSFSALVLSGLGQIGVELTEKEKDAYVHCWNIVGHFIGVSPELYPQNYNEGWNLGLAIIKRNQEESNDTKFLTKSLMDFSVQFFDEPLFNHIPEYLISFFVRDIGEKINIDLLKTIGIGDQLSVFAKIEGRLFIELLEIGNEIGEHSALARKIVAKYSLQHLQGMINHSLKTNNVAFYIPDSLKESWNMQ